MAEAFKKDGGQMRRVVMVPRSTLEGLELKRRLEKMKDLGVKVEVLYLSKYCAGTTSTSTRRGATKLIEMLTGEKPRVYKRCSGWTATKGTGRHRSLGPIRGARGQ